MQTANEWAIEQFRSVELGDLRRTARIIEMAERMARRPSDTLPKQMNNWHEQKAAYRLFSPSTTESVRTS